VKTAAIIPARIGSTRFPRKALTMLGGKLMINRVWEAVRASGLFDEVIVATDSQEILSAVINSGGKAQMTRADHFSGSDRVAEVAQSLDAELIVNVQGDEPFIDTQALAALLDCFSDPGVLMASLMTACADPDLLKDPNVVKVVTDRQGRALYFSRSQIPCDRDGSSNHKYMRHIGVYAWRRETLLSFVALKPSALELCEKLEQLRALENGIGIQMVETGYQGIGVDTPEDLARAEELLKSQASL